jgi:hypothetical protein
LGEVDCVGQGIIGYVAEPLTKTVASWRCPLQSMVRDIVRIYTRREEWTVKVTMAGSGRFVLTNQSAGFTNTTTTNARFV